MKPSPRAWQRVQAEVMNGQLHSASVAILAIDRHRRTHSYRVRLQGPDGLEEDYVAELADLAAAVKVGVRMLRQMVLVRPEPR